MLDLLLHTAEERDSRASRYDGLRSIGLNERSIVKKPLAMRATGCYSSQEISSCKITLLCSVKTHSKKFNLWSNDLLTKTNKLFQVIKKHVKYFFQ